MATPPHQETVEQVVEYKAQGNDCIKKESFSEALLHYTTAIKLELTLPKQYVKTLPQLHSNRSLAFLKLKQYHLALEDAKETIKLNPLWVKGYYRLGEVQFATENYSEALTSYTRATRIDCDPNVIKCALRCNEALLKQEKMDRQIPWVAAGCGLILGVILVVADAVIPHKSSFNHPVVQVLVTMLISIAGLFVGYGYRWYMQSSRQSYLDPPPDLTGNSGNDNIPNGDSRAETTTKEKSHHPRYTKGQAKLRFRKGKS